jgi:acetyl-CoA C-acetyltransferase
MRNGVKLTDQKMVDGMIKDGLWCASCDVHMGRHAEYTATKAGATREDQDEFAAASHRKAVSAIEAGKFKSEIARVEIPGKNGPTVVDTDEGPRKDTTVEALAKLRPAFPGKNGQNENLSVTAGNASSLNDGAAALIVVSEEYAEAHNLEILGRITGYATGATKPEDLFFAPIKAVRNLMAKTGKKIEDFDLIEANEAFASQALADGDELGWDWKRVNVNGGAIALGHPIGASGARMVTVPLRSETGFHPDVDALAAAVTPKTRVMWINSPHNPTGAVFTRDEIEAIAALCRRHGGAVDPDIDVHR